MRIGIAIAIVTFLLVAVYLASSKPALRIAGLPLRKCLIQAYIYDQGFDTNAIQTLRLLGEPAIHELARMVATRDSPLVAKVDKFPILSDLFPTKYWTRLTAAKALGEIGTNATRAIPALEFMAKDSNRDLARAAKAALVLVRNDSIDRIAADFTEFVENNETNCAYSFALLMELGTHAKVAIPRLFDQVHSTNDRVRSVVSLLLGYVGTESPECVAVFTNMLNDPNALVRAHAINGLAHCGEMGKSSAPLIAGMLDDPDEYCRRATLYYLSTIIAPQEFAPFQLPVEHATNDVNQTVRELAQEVLREKSLAR